MANYCIGRPPEGAEWVNTHVFDDDGRLWDLFEAPGAQPGWTRFKLVSRSRVHGPANFTGSYLFTDDGFQRFGLERLTRLKDWPALYVQVKQHLRGFCPVDRRTGYVMGVRITSGAAAVR